MFAVRLGHHGDYLGPKMALGVFLKDTAMRYRIGSRAKVLNHSKVEASRYVPCSTSELAGLNLHTITLMLNVKQGSCEY